MSHENSHTQYLMTNPVLTRDIDRPVSRLLFAINPQLFTEAFSILDHVSSLFRASRLEFTADAFHVK